MRTGYTVDTLGLYATECCSEERTFDVGDTFTRCPRCERLCLWELESEVEDKPNVDPARITDAAA